MSDVTRMERIEAAIVEMTYEGSYRPAEVKKYAWMCNGCGLVWSMRHQARDCESRQHATSYVQEYWTNGFNPVTGKPNPPNLYPREAIRRESPATPERTDYETKVGNYIFHVSRNPEAQSRSFIRRCGEPRPVAKPATIRSMSVWIFRTDADDITTHVCVTPEQAIALELPSR